MSGKIEVKNRLFEKSTALMKIREAKQFCISDIKVKVGELETEYLNKISKLEAELKTIEETEEKPKFKTIAELKTALNLPEVAAIKGKELKGEK